MNRPCLVCGKPTPNTRCPEHTRPNPYTADYRRRRAIAINAEPWCHTYPRCPYPDAGTRANPLTAEHVVRVANDGADGPLVTLCKRCNSGWRRG